MEITEENKTVQRKFAVWIYLPAFAVLTFICFIFYGGIASGLLFLLHKSLTPDEGLLVVSVMETAMLLAVLTSVVVLFKVEERPFSELGLSVKGHAAGIWYGMLVAFLVYAIGFGFSLAINEVEVTGIHFDLLHLAVSWSFFLLVALTEEIMIRGYVLGLLLRHNINRFLALFISSVLFSLLHIFNPNFAFLPMLNLILAGFLLGASFLYTRNLWFPISLHLFWNWLQGPVLGYQVSGNKMKGMFTLHLPEETVWNGGSFGFEGSLISSVLMVLFTILIIVWGEKRQRTQNKDNHPVNLLQQC